MLTTCLVVCTVALSAGQVVAVPPGTELTAANRFDWVLREQPFVAPAGTRALVVKVAPEGLDGVVEVKVFDGTHRRAWLDATALAPTTATVAPRVLAAVNAGGTRAYERPGDSSPRRRKVRRPDFTAVDAALASMLQDALRAQAASPGGIIIGRPDVFHMPVFQMEVFHMPVFGMDVFHMPVF